MTDTRIDTDWHPSASLAMLQRRAALLHQIRAFFYAKGVMEVDTPVISIAANTDVNIDSLQTSCLRQVRYLHTSPEFPMKRLLAAGSGDIYQICKVFRDGEQGTLHNPEFTLLEWYRSGYSLQMLMQEVAQLVRQVAGPDSAFNEEAVFISYQRAFIEHLRLDPLQATLSELRQAAIDAAIPDAEGLTLERDGWLDLLLSFSVVPCLPRLRLVFLHHYPASQAALARLDEGNSHTALRFELFMNGIEIANGYDELADAAMLRDRFEEDNHRRQLQGRPVMPLDLALLEALQSGLPACAGVALGLDRLLLVLEGVKTLSEVLAFDASRA